MIAPLTAALKKEFLLLLRDIHGLLLLFVMPTVFIVIMSLAMQDSFDALQGAKLTVLVDDRANNEASRKLIDNIEAGGAFELESVASEAGDTMAQIGRDRAAFLIALYPLEAADNNDNPIRVDVTVAPSTNKQMEAIFVATLRELLRGLKVESLLAGLEDSAPNGDGSVEALARVALNVQYAYDRESQQAPSAVQQNVPAWLVFALFFVVVPLSNTLIRERQFGTLKRLQTIAVSPAVLIVGKLVPYFVIMQLQVILMLLVGRYLVPLLGGDGLALGHAPLALALMAASVSIAALGYALLIAVTAHTTEQATTLGGAGNIILAALGGIMVPRVLMPEVMQQLGQLSPMAWALEGFLDVLLRGGSFALVWPKALALTAFGAVLALVAFGILARDKAH